MALSTSSGKLVASSTLGGNTAQPGVAAGRQSTFNSLLSAMSKCMGNSAVLTGFPSRIFR
eukprot:3894966-Amphidinium_carterae.1